MSLRRPRFEDEEPASAINISPLIDVIFILLIFFIVTMVFADNDAMGRRCPICRKFPDPRFKCGECRDNLRWKRVA